MKNHRLRPAAVPPLPLCTSALLLLALLAGCAHHRVPPQRETDYDAVVIGAGMGGLSAAAHLATAGMKVLVLEQHHKVGGVTTSFARGDFRFETALHEMDGAGPEGPIRTLLADVGVLDKIELIPIPALYRSIFPDVQLTVPTDPEAARTAFAERWPEEREAIDRYFEMLTRLRNDVDELKDLYRSSPTGRFFRILGVPFGQSAFFSIYRKTLQTVLDDLFVAPLLKAVISQFWVYYGPPPSRLWAPIFFMANGSYHLHGAWHIKGTSQALSDAYAERIGELGGTVLTGTRVTGIRVEDGFVRGVETEHGDLYSARYVVSNADPFQTFFTLLPESASPESWRTRIRSMKPANSLVGLYLGLDVPPDHWGIEEHELFYNTSTDADAMYEAMMEGRYEEGAIAVTLYSNLGDPCYAPPGKSVVVVHSYATIDTWPDERDAYLAHRKAIEEQLLALLEKVMPGVSDHVEVSEMITPRSLEAFTSSHGGIPYGWDFIVDQGVDRLPNETPVGGLFLAGAWAGPSHGVSAAQLSGRQAAQLILDTEEEGR